VRKSNETYKRAEIAIFVCLSLPSTDGPFGQSQSCSDQVPAAAVIQLIDCKTSRDSEAHRASWAADRVL
jgi:hypothetical protein